VLDTPFLATFKSEAEPDADIPSALLKDTANRPRMAFLIHPVFFKWNLFITITLIEIEQKKNIGIVPSRDGSGLSAYDR
jgi:hypothetical protein